MEKQTFEKVKKLCEPLLKFKPLVKAIWIYGSSVKKKKAHDIDILVLVDDTLNLTEKKLERIIKTIGKIENKTPKNIALHFQKPILLTRWWSLIVKGEPWVITAIKKPLIVYDESDYVSLMSRILRKKEIYGKDIKAERLVERAEKLLVENREIMLRTVEELFMAASEAAQIFLLTKHKILFKPKNILKEIEKYLNADVYREISDLNEKVSKGVLSEFTGEKDGKGRNVERRVRKNYKIPKI